MCLSLSFLFLFSLASPYFLSASAQDFEISPDILLAGSPAAMLFAFLDTQEDFSGASQALAALPSVCKTQGLAETLTSSRSSSSEAVAANVDCNLTGVDPECFLINLAGQVGKTWSTQLADESRAAEMIERLLKKQGLTLQAAAAACAAAPLAVPLLTQFGSALPSAAEVIAEASEACRV